MACIDRSDFLVQITIVTGRNEKLYKKLKRKKFVKKTKILGYVKDMDESDLTMSQILRLASL